MSPIPACAVWGWVLGIRGFLAPGAQLIPMPAATSPAAAELIKFLLSKIMMINAILMFRLSGPFSCAR